MAYNKIQISEKLGTLFKTKLGGARYRIAYGGRGSGKSYTFALMALINGYLKKLRILCTREYQVSIKQSFYAELRLVIEEHSFLRDHYLVGENFIRGKNGTEFIFKGLRHNISNIKSITRIGICIIEEATDVPFQSWVDLIPTIRAPESEIWIIFNPKQKSDPVWKIFIDTPHENSLITKVNYYNNPWFPQVLNDQRKHDLKFMEPALYEWIWNGNFLKRSKSQIFQNCYKRENFDLRPSMLGPYFGLDFGFSQDPTACVEVYIENNTLFVYQECGKIGLELDQTADFLKRHHEKISKSTIRADSARPESISYLKRHGLPRIEGVKKGKNSIEDGIAFLKSFDQIVIHFKCEKTYQEFELYSYKTDRLTNDVLPTPIDKHNHFIDAIRYAIEPMIKSSSYNLKSLLTY